MATSVPAHRRRSVRALLAVVGLAAPAALVAGATGGTPALAAEGAPHLALEAPATYRTYSFEGRVWDDFGIWLVAGQEPFELWLQRLSYHQPITVTAVSPSGIPLSDGMRGLTSTLGGLEDFLTFEFTPLDSDRASFTRLKDGCLGGETVRIRPDAPPRSPYPPYCQASRNAYSLGAVQGIEAGYASSALAGGRFRLRAGEYDVTVSVSDPWADAIGLGDSQRSVSQHLTVEKYEECHERRGCRAAPGGSASEPQPAATEPSPRALVDPTEPPEGTPLPDLRSLPAWGMQISRNGDFLQFSATVWNAGDSPLVVDGFRRPAEDLMDAYQYFFDADGDQLDQYVAVGGFEWDPKKTHQHWHFQSFASYTLVPEGHEPHPTDPDDHHVKSRKEAFCLAPTDAVDMTVEGADWSTEEADLGTACGDYGSRAIREVLASGWGDTYAQFRAGQSFGLRGLPNGCYDIVVEGNPPIGDGGNRILVESDYTNNSYSRTVCIGGRDGARTIESVEQIGIIDEGTVVRP